MTTATLQRAPRATKGWPQQIRALRDLSLRGLARMYLPDEQLFAFRVRKAPDRPRLEGISYRYTAIALLGLVGEEEDAVRQVLAGKSSRDLCGRLLADVIAMDNLGDVALTAWVSRILEHVEAPRALGRLKALLNEQHESYTVEIAWALSALCEGPQDDAVTAAREQAAERLLSVYSPRAALFRHHSGGAVSAVRQHVACFADLVYPIQALARHAVATGDARSLEVAEQCAARVCSLIGPAGQWWWHYDARTGKVLERYPVYAVHQDAMGPMALFALHEAGGTDYRAEIENGWNWLHAAPELGGGTLIDPHNEAIWRKVARREPRKFVRSAQAAVSRLHSAIRVPLVDLLFPPGPIDDECRPYHLGWLLYSWPERRVAEIERSLEAS